MPGIIRRRAVLSGAATASAVLATRRDARADLKALEDAARPEATLTWYIAQVDAETAEMLGRAFTKEYPGIKVAVIRTTGQVAYQRLQLDIKNRTPQCDVFSTTDISHMPVLKERKEITPFKPENAAQLLPEFQRLSDDGYAYVTNAARLLLIYNTNKVSPAEAPRAWTDLLDPKWKGKVATGHPAFSGCTGVWVVGMRKLYGWRYFEQLARNNPRIGRSGVDPVTLVTAGEASVGVAAAGNAYPSAERGNPMGISYPTDGLSLCVMPSAIPANAPHLNAAKLFMEWLLSQGYARLVAADGTEPTVEGVPPRPGMPPLSDHKVIPLTIAEIRAGVPEVIELWRETFGN